MMVTVPELPFLRRQVQAWALSPAPAGGAKLLSLEPGKGGRKEGPARQFFVSGLPEACASCLLASYPCTEPRACSQARPQAGAHIHTQKSE